jgi:tRNA(Ile)-lysidine synthase
MLENFLYLKDEKNLLAFSGGADSTALFYLLLENNIPFDITHVNYNTRDKSLDEKESAIALATKYNKKIFYHDTYLEARNFEAQARKVRYDFFEKTIMIEKYDNLLTAHHLGDKLEWFLMQLTKGAGLPEMLGMSYQDKRENYTLVRPLLNYDKKVLINYLENKNIPWFEDSSNYDESYKRNYFRHNFSNKLLEHYASGVAKSFEYLERDKEELITTTNVKTIDTMSYFKRTTSRRSDIIMIDKTLKQRGYIMRSGDRENLLKNSSVEVGRVFSIMIENEWIFIIPKTKSIVMDKAFKEQCREKKIPSKLRPYLFHLEVTTLSTFLKECF